MRVVLARCSVNYRGRLETSLETSDRLLILKNDGTLLIHAETLHKPLNWMTSPASTSFRQEEDHEVWTFVSKAGETLTLNVYEIHEELNRDLGPEPGLTKDGVEAHLQALLAEHPHTLGEGWSLVQREYPTAIGPVDILCRDASGRYVAVEVKRRGEIDGVEQLTRYLELLNRDPRLGEVSGVLAAQQIKPQARVLAGDRGISCVLVDYDSLRGMDNAEDRLF